MKNVFLLTLMFMVVFVPTLYASGGGQKKVPGPVHFLLQEMKKDGISKDIIEKYQRKYQATAKGDKQKRMKILSDAIEDAYGIRFWQLIKFNSVDGITIPGYLTLPAGKGNVPSVVLVHGASHGNSRIYQKYAFRLAKNGYATLAVDYRSSTGHGDYLKNADDPGPGGKEFDDVIAALNFLKKHKRINKDKLGLLGGSRGAYISANVITKMNLSAAALAYGGYDAEKMAATAPAEKDAPPKPSNDDDGDDNYEQATSEASKITDKETLHERSPIYLVDKIKTPIVLVHGDKDIIVPFEQSVDFSKALEKAGKHVEMKIYNGEGHGFIFQDTEAADDAFNFMLNFLNKFMKGK